MLETQRKILESQGVTFRANNSEIHFGFGQLSTIQVESPCEFRPGHFDIDFIGAYTYLGGGHTVARHIKKIGRFCSIAPNLHAGLVEHPTDFLSANPIFQGGWKNLWHQLDVFNANNSNNIKKSYDCYNDILKTKFKKIIIGNDVWIGDGVLIRRGVKIGDGAIIASHSVVTKDVEPYMIVGGVPAKPIRLRFEEKVIEKLLHLKWWDYGLNALDGCDFTDMGQSIAQIEKNINNAHFIYTPPQIITIKNGNEILIN